MYRAILNDLRLIECQVEARRLFRILVSGTLRGTVWKSFLEGPEILGTARSELRVQIPATCQEKEKEAR